LYSITGLPARLFIIPVWRFLEGGVRQPDRVLSLTFQGQE